MLFERYSRQSAEMILKAEQHALQNQQSEIFPENLFWAFLEKQDPFCLAKLSQSSWSLLQWKEKLSEILILFADPSTKTKNPSFSSKMLRLFQTAEKTARSNESELVKTTHLLESCLLALSPTLQKHWNADFIVSKGISERANEEDFFPPMPSQNFFRNLSLWEKEQGLGACLGREKEVLEAFHVLSKRSKNNLILVGEIGVGRASVVFEMVRKTNQKKVPHSGLEKTFYQLEERFGGSNLKDRKEWEKQWRENLQSISFDLSSYLYLSDIQEWMESSQSIGLSSLLQPVFQAIQTRGLRCIFSITPTGWKQIEKQISFQKHFQALFLEETNDEQTLQILKGQQKELEVYHQIQIEEQALQASIRLSKKYIPEGIFPSKALDLLDETACRLKISKELLPLPIQQLQEKLLNLDGLPSKGLSEEQNKMAQQIKHLTQRWKQEKEELSAIQFLQEKLLMQEGLRLEAQEQQNFLKASQIQYDIIWPLQEELSKLRLQREEKECLLKEKLTAQEVALCIQKKTGIPVSKIMGDEKKKLLDMKEILSSRIIGQEEAIDSIVSCVQRSRSGLSNPNKPLGSFLFLGPTGVGKTELAKALTEVLLDDVSALIRFDMSEFMEKHNASRLIGAPPGYLGFEQGGELTEKVRTSPYSIVLFDEFEKAHPDVFLLLLQVLDDGFLTDSQGRKVDFTQTIVIMTSNVGATQLLEKKSIEKELQKTFRPEFLNRLDEIITFKALTQENLRFILKSQLKKLQERLEEQQLRLSVSEQLEAELLRAGTQLEMGARPLQRILQSMLQTPLAQAILEGCFPEGSNIQADWTSQKVVLSLQS